MSTPLDYVKLISHLGSGKQQKYFDWLLKNGKVFTDKATIQTVQEIIKKNYVEVHPKSCFYNSQQLSIMLPEAEYYEGYATTSNGVAPLQHAFNVINGKVVDITWKDGLEYFGIKIPTDFIQQRWYTTGYSDSYLNVYYRSID